jgi:hypothetical protein
MSFESQSQQTVARYDADILANFVWSISPSSYRIHPRRQISTLFMSVIRNELVLSKMVAAASSCRFLVFVSSEGRRKQGTQPMQISLSPEASHLVLPSPFGCLTVGRKRITRSTGDRLLWVSGRSDRFYPNGSWFNWLSLQPFVHDQSIKVALGWVAKGIRQAANLPLDQQILVLPVDPA